MARQRDYAAEYARRQARAREAGFGSYYERRVGGATGPALARARGHRSRADLIDASREGAVVSVVSTERGADGRYTKVTVSVLSPDGKTERDFTLRRGQLTDAKIAELAGALGAAGAIQSPAYPLSRLYRDLEELELDEEMREFDEELGAA